MSNNGDLERRVAALEQRMDDVYTLAAGASSEAGEVKALLLNHGRVINGWGMQLSARLDNQGVELAEIRQRLDGIDGRLDGIDGRLDGIDGRLGGHDQLFATVLGGQEQILALLNQLVGDEGGQAN